MEGAGEGATDAQSLSDIQNYLENFNKEISDSNQLMLAGTETEDGAQTQNGPVLSTAEALFAQGQVLDTSGSQNPVLIAPDGAQLANGQHMVAVKTQDGGQQMVTVAGVDGEQQPMVLNAAGNAYQTVTIVPSEVQQDGEVSYVLIVSQPDGEKTGDMSVYDFKEEKGVQDEEHVEDEVEQPAPPPKPVRPRATPKKQVVQNVTTQLMCNYCNYTSPKRYLLTRHMKTHSEERPHKCHICDRGFKTVASLQNHINTHTGVRPHKCKECDAAFTTSGELVRHVRYRHTFEKPHKCIECDYASVELSKLKRHMRSHTGERPYQCPHCQYASPDTYKLKRHLRIHTGEKPYECDICHARFTQSNSLKAHKLIHSGNKPVFQCELCPTTCGRKTDLKIHVQKLHTSDKPLICKKCGKSFPDRYTWKIHLKTHEGEKCFKCELCNYSALSQRHLESHILTHTGEKPYRCDECDQSFRQKQLLKRHKNLYHNPDYVPPAPKDKVHECTECMKVFAHRGNLWRHMASHDPDNPLYSEENIRREEMLAMQEEEGVQDNSIMDIQEMGLRAMQEQGILGPQQVQVQLVGADGQQQGQILVQIQQGEEETAIPQLTHEGVQQWHVQHPTKQEEEDDQLEYEGEEGQQEEEIGEEEPPQLEAEVLQPAEEEQPPMLEQEQEEEMQPQEMEQLEPEMEEPEIEQQEEPEMEVPPPIVEQATPKRGRGRPPSKKIKLEDEKLTPKRRQTEEIKEEDDGTTVTPRKSPRKAVHTDIAPPPIEIIIAYPSKGNPGEYWKEDSDENESNALFVCEDASNLSKESKRFSTSTPRRHVSQDSAVSQENFVIEVEVEGGEVSPVAFNEEGALIPQRSLEFIDTIQGSSLQHQGKCMTSPDIGYPESSTNPDQGYPEENVTNQGYPQEIVATHHRRYPEKMVTAPNQGCPEESVTTPDQGYPEESVTAPERGYPAENITAPSEGYPEETKYEEAPREQTAFENDAQVYSRNHTSMKLPIRLPASVRSSIDVQAMQAPVAGIRQISQYSANRVNSHGKRNVFINQPISPIKADNNGGLAFKNLQEQIFDYDDKFRNTEQSVTEIIQLRISEDGIEYGANGEDGIEYGANGDSTQTNDQIIGFENGHGVAEHQGNARTRELNPPNTYYSQYVRPQFCSSSTGNHYRVASQAQKIQCIDNTRYGYGAPHPGNVYTTYQRIHAPPNDQHIAYNNQHTYGNTIQSSGSFNQYTRTVNPNWNMYSSQPMNYPIPQNYTPQSVYQTVNVQTLKISEANGIPNFMGVQQTVTVSDQNEHTTSQEPTAKTQWNDAQYLAL